MCGCTVCWLFVVMRCVCDMKPRDDMRIEYCRSYLCVSVFFFKQKTAYELRISDWSSDVCSSDLLSGFATQLVETDAAGAMGDQEQEAAGDREVLHQHDLVDLIARAVEQQCRGNAEPGDQQRDRPREQAEHDGDAAAEFERDHQWQQRARHAPRFHVLLCSS